MDSRRPHPGMPALVRAAGYLLFSSFLLSFFWFHGLSAQSLASVDFAVELLTKGPFLGGILYGGYRLPRSGLSSDRYPRIGKWFVGGLAGFLLLNLVMIAVWPADATYNNVAWALFAAAAGGAGGLGIGIFEARAIERAVAVERDRVRRRELERRNEQLEEFTSIVSHDLRNPLNVATGRLELARQDCESEHLAAVASAHARMEAIVDRTLTLARSGQAVSDTEHLELKAVANGCWKNVATADTTLDVDGSTTLEADRDRLAHLFENLFRNAVEHAGPDVTVRVGTTDTGFYVEDDGPGIPTVDREDVFEVGHSTSDDGTGFGLNIVEQVVEAHGWEVRVTDGRDGGARFEVTGVEFASG